MPRRLRVGVVGVGRRWQRYRAALGRLNSLRVKAVCAPAQADAEREAASLCCVAVGGVMELLARPDIEGVLIVDPGWQGLWPLEQACRAGKPALCAALPRGEEERVQELAARTSGEAVRVVMGVAPRFWHLVVQVWFLLERQLGPARFLRLSCTGPARPGRESALDAPQLLPMLLACRELFEAEPDALRVAGLPGRPGYGCLSVGFPEGQVAELSVWLGPSGAPSCRIEFVAERGSGIAELPGQLRWTDASGSHTRRLPPGLAEVEVLESFAQSILARMDAGPTLQDVAAGLAWLRQAREG